MSATATQRVYAERRPAGFPRCALVTNLCPPYREPIFRRLTKDLGVDLFLFGRGALRFWDPGALECEIPLSLPQPSGGQIARWRYLRKLTRTIDEGPYDVVIKCINGKPELASVWWATRRSKKRFVLWTGLWHHPRGPVHMAGYPFLRHIYRDADAVCVYGNHVRDYLITKGVRNEDIFVVGQPTPALGEPVSGSLPPGTSPYFIFVGRLAPEKGLGYLIRALESLQPEPVTLVLVGSGPEEARLRSLAARLGPSQKVIFMGTSSGPSLARLYHDARALVLPSITTASMREQWGLVVNEAMALGVPVVATTAVGAAAGGLVEDGVTGMVVPERSPEGLARSLRALLKEPELGKRLGETGRRRVAEISYEKMFQRFKDAILHAASR